MLSVGKVYRMLIAKPFFFSTIQPTAVWLTLRSGIVLFTATRFKWG